MTRFRCLTLALIIASIGMVATAISENATYKDNNSLDETLNDSLLITNFSISGSVDFSGEIFEGATEFNRTTIEGEVNFNRTLLNGVKYERPDMRWDKINHDQYEDKEYLARIATYEWLTKHDNYNWSNDANYCYIDYRNKRLGLPDRVWFLTGSNWFFTILLIILFIIFLILLCFFDIVPCRDQSKLIDDVIPLLALTVYILLLFGIFIVTTTLLLYPDKMWDFLSFISSGYGRRPLYTIFLSLLVIFIFSLHIYWGYHKMKELRQSQRLSLGRSFWLSAAIFFSASIKDKDKEISDWMGPLAVIERALGWLLLAVFIATLNNVVIIRS